MRALQSIAVTGKSGFSEPVYVEDTRTWTYDPRLKNLFEGIYGVLDNPSDEGMWTQNAAVAQFITPTDIDFKVVHAALVDAGYKYVTGGSHNEQLCVLIPGHVSGSDSDTSEHE